MKRKLLFFLVTLLPMLASAYDACIDGIYYNLIEKAKIAEVTMGPLQFDDDMGVFIDSYTGDVVIPESVIYNGKTYSVTSIGSEAFYGCSSLTSVTIPGSVTSIGSEAFGFTGLQKVIVPDIAAWCGISFCDEFSNPLYYAPYLYSDEETIITNLVIPEGVTRIEGYVFEGCSSLTSVTIPNSVTSIGERAFYECSGLQKVIVPDIAAWCGISFDDGYANPLYYAHHLYSDENTEITDLVIPEGVTSIGDGAFCYCRGLTSVTIPNSVTSIGEGAFSQCI